MRGLFLKMSLSPTTRWMVTHMPLSDRAAKRFIAGETLDEALEAARRVNAEGKMGTLDYLGENVFTREEADHATEASCRILEALHARKLDCDISIKLTSMGQDLGHDVAHANLKRVLETATRLKNTVWIDMEGSDYTQRTLDLFWEAHREYGCVRAVIQAYLFRTAGDIDRFCAEGAPVRLCKGAYQEPPDVAFPLKPDVDQNYKRQLDKLLHPDAIARGTYPAVATHDPAMIAHAVGRIREHQIPKEKFEFQMLYGVRRDLQDEIVRDGYRLRIYIPYGEQWYPYFMRRLAERPANVWFVLKNLAQEKRS